MQIKLIFTTKVSHLASFWKWDFLELGNGLLADHSNFYLHVLKIEDKWQFQIIGSPQIVYNFWLRCHLLNTERGVEIIKKHVFFL